MRLSECSELVRAPTVLTSLLPAVAGGVCAIGRAGVDWGLAPVGLVALACLHAGVNLSNEVEDTARGVDPADKTRRTSGMFRDGGLTLSAGRRIYAALFGVALLLGVVICVVRGPAPLLTGLIGVAGGLLYTAGPVPYKYAGLGEALIVWLMGPLLTQGAYAALTGQLFSAPAFWIGAGPGLLIAAVLLANNLDDITDDAAAGARTLAVRIGFLPARRLWVALALLVPIGVLAVWAAGLLDAWVLLALLVAPALLMLTREVARMPAPRAPGLATLVPRTAGLHMAFSALLITGVVLARAL